MRRKDRQTDDTKVADEIFQNCEVGYLAITTKDSYPRAIPVNFVHEKGNIYFHGARAGEKFDFASTGPKAGFIAAEELAYISSEWLGKDACNATHLFQSVNSYGVLSIVEEETEKARALEALMLKYQPEGSFTSFNDENHGYDKMLIRTAIFRFKIETRTIKRSLGEYFTEEERSKVVDHLKKRNRRKDSRTIDLIQQFYN